MDKIAEPTNKPDFKPQDRSSDYAALITKIRNSDWSSMDDECNSDESHVFGSGSIGSGMDDNIKEHKGRKPRHRSKKKVTTRTDVIPGVSSSMDNFSVA
jgi:hypothetical protein